MGDIHAADIKSKRKEGKVSFNESLTAIFSPIDFLRRKFFTKIGKMQIDMPALLHAFQA